MQIKAVWTFGLRYKLRLRSSAVISYLPKFASVIAMTNQSSEMAVNTITHDSFYMSDIPASNLATSSTAFSMASTIDENKPMRVSKEKKIHTSVISWERILSYGNHLLDHFPSVSNLRGRLARFYQGYWWRISRLHLLSQWHLYKNKTFLTCPTIYINDINNQSMKGNGWTHIPDVFIFPAKPLECLHQHNS